MSVSTVGLETLLEDEFSSNTLTGNEIVNMLDERGFDCEKVDHEAEATHSGHVSVYRVDGGADVSTLYLKHNSVKGKKTKVVDYRVAAEEPGESGYVRGPESLPEEFRY